jgi:hypothetical protein
MLKNKRIIDYIKSNLDKSDTYLVARGYSMVDENTSIIDVDKFIQNIRLTENYKNQFKTVYSTIDCLRKASDQQQLKELESQLLKTTSKTQFLRLKGGLICEIIESIVDNYEFRKENQISCLSQNVKIYDYLNENDFDAELLKFENITEKQKEVLRNKLCNYETFSSIFYDSINRERDYLFEYIGGCTDLKFNHIDKNNIGFIGRQGGYVALMDNTFDGEELSLDYFGFEDFKKLCELNGLNFFKNPKSYGNLRSQLEFFENQLEDLEIILEKLLEFDDIATFCKETVKNFKSILVDDLNYLIENELMDLELEDKKLQESIKKQNYQDFTFTTSFLANKGLLKPIDNIDPLFDEYLKLKGEFQATDSKSYLAQVNQFFKNKQ